MPISIEEGEKNSDLQSTYIDGSALCEGFEKKQWYAALCDVGLR